MTKDLEAALKCELREELAALAHAQWSRWMEYLFARCSRTKDGALVIPKEDVKRWKRQIATDYASLPTGEQQSDRKEADRFLDIFVSVLYERDERIKKLEGVLGDLQATLAECVNANQEARFHQFNCKEAAKTAALEAADSDKAKASSMGAKDDILDAANATTALYREHCALLEIELEKWKDRAEGWAKNHQEELELRVELEARVKELESQRGYDACQAEHRKRAERAEARVKELEAELSDIREANQVELDQALGLAKSGRLLPLLVEAIKTLAKSLQESRVAAAVMREALEKICSHIGHSPAEMSANIARIAREALSVLDGGKK